MEAGRRSSLGRILLLTLTCLLTATWVLLAATLRDWILVDHFFLIPLNCLILPSWVLLLVGALVHILVKLFRRQWSIYDVVPLAAIVVGFLVGLCLPSKPEAVLWLHRAELTRLIAEANSECQETGDDFVLRPTSFYDEARVFCSFSGVQSIEFIISSPGVTFHYMPRLRFDPSPGATVRCGYGVRGWYWCNRIEPHWYYCSRYEG